MATTLEQSKDSELNKRNIVIVVTSVALALNLLVLIKAYPYMFSHLNPNFARDFSAYYIGAWRLFFDPSHVYSGATVPGEYYIFPGTAAFKYLPSFLIFVSPLLLLNYQQAFIAFDIAQFLLLPAIAFLIYRILRNYSVWIVSSVIVLAILEPNPFVKFGSTYFWEWAQGQDKVLQMFLIVLSLYFASRNKPILSGIVLGLSFFDPRFPLLALPLFTYYSKKKIRRTVLGFVPALVIPNLLLVYDGMLQGFWQMLVNFGVRTPFYGYALIPILTLGCLTSLEFWNMLSVRWMGSEKKMIETEQLISST